jgi:hypothetical protein
MIGSLAALLVLPACAGDVIDDRCLGEELARVTARTPMISVNDTVTFQAELIPGDCLPPDIGTPDWRWSSLDTLVARIDSVSGVAEGVGLGEVLIQAVERGSDVSAATLLQVSSPAGAARGRDSL